MTDEEFYLIVGVIGLTGWLILLLLIKASAINKNTEQILTMLSKIYEKDDD